MVWKDNNKVLQHLRYLRMVSRRITTFILIRSCSKLAYEDAQCVLEGGLIPPNVAIYGHYNHDKVANDILLLNSIASNKRERRYAEGSLSLNSVKLNFDLDEYGEPISVHQFQQKEANRLIEEFMLSANISVAREITESFPDEALLRRHEEPLERRLVCYTFFYKLFLLFFLTYALFVNV